MPSTSERLILFPADVLLPNLLPEFHSRVFATEQQLSQAPFPFGTVIPYGLDEGGRPISLRSTMAMHTQNLKADPRATFRRNKLRLHIWDEFLPGLA